MPLLIKDANTQVQSLSTSVDSSANLVPVHIPAAPTVTQGYQPPPKGDNNPAPPRGGSSAKRPEVERRLRKLRPSELADECGGLQADIASIKAEMIRRGLDRAEGDVFRLSLSRPSEYQRFDRPRYELDFGALPAGYMTTVMTDWQMRCTARRRA